MKAKLLASDEATPSKYWGCGFSMTNLKEIGEGKNPGINKFRHILKKIRNELRNQIFVY